MIHEATKFEVTVSSVQNQADPTAKSVDPETMRRFSFAKSLVLEAGAIANGYFSQVASLTVQEKGRHDLVSEADMNTERFIKQRLADVFPQDSFFGEETGMAEIDGAVGIWVVDPIDGTQPFLSSLPNWCISIACVMHGEVQFGLIFSPPTNELFSGGKGIPATVNDSLLTPHPGTTLASGLVSVGFSPRSPREFLFNAMGKLLDRGGMFFRNGSGALSLAYVAAGRLLGHVEPHMHSWDCLAAIAIIEAAGGRVNNFLSGDALLKGNKVIAGAPAVYDELEWLLGDS